MKIKVSSVLDLSQYLSTGAGRQLKGALEYLAQFAEEIVTALTSNLNYADNFSCEIKNVQLRTGISTVIKTSKDTPVKEIRIRRIYDDIYYTVQSFGWKYDSSGQIILTVSFDGSPGVDRTISADIIIYYG